MGDFGDGVRGRQLHLRPALRDFAIVGSLGLAGALLCTVFLLPALLVILDRWRSLCRQKTTAKARRTRRQTRRKTTRGSPPFASFFALFASSRLFPKVVVPPPSPPPVFRCGHCWGGSTAAPGRASSPGRWRWGRRWRTWPRPGPGWTLEPDPTVLHPRPNPPLDAEAHIEQADGHGPRLADRPPQRGKPGATARPRPPSGRATGYGPAAREAGVASTFGLASAAARPGRRPAPAGRGGAGVRPTGSWPTSTPPSRRAHSTPRRTTATGRSCASCSRRRPPRRRRPRGLPAVGRRPPAAPGAGRRAGDRGRSRWSS